MLIKRMSILLTASLVAVTSYQIWKSYHCLTIRKINLSSSKITRPISLAAISDLHGRKFGEKNIELLKMMCQIRPDSIFVIGDMIGLHPHYRTAQEKNKKIFLQLLKDLRKICPVYISLGNCERHYTEENPYFSDEIAGTGVAFLEKAYMDTVINQQQIRIGGIYGAAYKNYEKFFCHEKDEENEKFLLDFQSTEKLKVMMSHRPDSFIHGDASKLWDIDLVVSGHTHGDRSFYRLSVVYVHRDKTFFPNMTPDCSKKIKCKLLSLPGLGAKLSFAHVSIIHRRLCR